jgi:hypothetical protein
MHNRVYFCPSVVSNRCIVYVIGNDVLNWKIVLFHQIRSNQTEGTVGSKSNLPHCALLAWQVRVALARYVSYMTHIVRTFYAYHFGDICAKFTPDARHVSESDASFACTCRARGSQQGMLLLAPSVYLVLKSKVRRKNAQTQLKQLLLNEDHCLGIEWGR